MKVKAAKKASIVLAVALVCSIGTSTFASHAKEEAEEVKAARGIVYDTDAYTQNDFEDHFQTYALPDSTFVFLSREKAISNTDQTNVVGIVKDYSTDELIVGATISVENEVLVATGKDGRFQIKNLPSGVYDWKIDAEGYCTAYYDNYDIHSMDGTTIFTFFIDKNLSISKDREALKNDTCGQIIPPNTVERGAYFTSAAARAMSSVPSVKNQITAVVDGKKYTPKRQEYIAAVVSLELFNVNHYSKLGMDNMQITRLYRAQAVAANTFLEYALSVYSNHSNENYDVCGSSCCQRYDPVIVTEFAINAVSDIFSSYGGVDKSEILFYKPSSSSYEYIWGAFFSSCYGQGTLDHEGQPALRQVACVDIEQGYGGHRKGMCQAGAAYRIKCGDLEDDVLMYYYRNCSIEWCRME